MNVNMHRFLHLAVTTSLCDLSDGDRLELVGEWYDPTADCMWQPLNSFDKFSSSVTCTFTSISMSQTK